jgi:hypothetical protein
MTAGRFTPRGGIRRPSLLESELIIRLRALPAGPSPDPGFSAELRAQLVSITARIIAESGGELSTAATLVQRPARAVVRGGRAGAAGVLRSIRRPVLAFASAAAVLVLMLGVAVWMSGSSLPGDSLYGVKRASENVKLSMAAGDVARGNTYLGFASNRVAEVSKLLGKPASMAVGGNRSAAGSVSPHTASLVASTLASADSDSRSGMQLLGRATVGQMSASPLSKLTGWIVTERAALTDIAGRVPAGDLTNRVKASLALLQRIQSRATALKAELGCPCLAQAVSDDLGPIPCSPCQSLAPAKPGGGATSPSGGAPGGSGGSGAGSSGPNGTQPTPSGVPTTATPPGGAVPGGGQPGGGGSGSGGGSGGSSGGIGQPSLSQPVLSGVPTSSLPIPTGSTGVRVPLPSISVSVPLLPSVTIPGLIGLN